MQIFIYAVIDRNYSTELKVLQTFALGRPPRVRKSAMYIILKND